MIVKPREAAGAAFGAVSVNIWHVKVYLKIEAEKLMVHFCGGNIICRRYL